MLTIFERYVFLRDFFSFIFLWIIVCLSVCLCARWVQCLRRLEKGVRSSITGVLDGFVTHHMGAGNQTLILQKRSQCSLLQSHLFIYSTLSFEARSLPLLGVGGSLHLCHSTRVKMHAAEASFFCFSHGIGTPHACAMYILLIEYLPSLNFFIIFCALE